MDLLICFSASDVVLQKEESKKEREWDEETHQMLTLIYVAHQHYKSTKNYGDTTQRFTRALCHNVSNTEQVGQRKLPTDPVFVRATMNLFSKSRTTPPLEDTTTAFLNI